MTQLPERVFIVTGAASGIGRAVAVGAARQGARVVLVDMNEAGLQETARSIQEAGGRCAVQADDVTHPDYPARTVSFARSQFGRIDGCVPCAGMIRIRPLQLVTRDEWESVLTLNLTSVFFLAREVAEAATRDGNGGSIVTLSSTSAHGARPNNVDYGVSKLGIDHLTRTLALEYAPANVRVNAVSPGVTATPMWSQVDRDRGAHLGLAPGELTRKTVSQIPMGRVAQPSEIAALVCFLLSDAARYVTGQVIEIDGGFKLANP